MGEQYFFVCRALQGRGAVLRSMEEAAGGPETGGLVVSPAGRLHRALGRAPRRSRNARAPSARVSNILEQTGWPRRTVPPRSTGARIPAAYRSWRIPESKLSMGRSARWPL
jgi:hypothetical protein